jgi:uncharacterized NAD(P)/FAD-binding protein YdhS
MIRHVAIVGGGFSGSLQAINLHRHGGPKATLIEQRRQAGEGLAYGSAHPSHVLNVRASNMSALPDEPDHFVRWLEARGVSDAGHAFVPRITYGAYLRELLQGAMQQANGGVEIVHGQVLDIVENGATSLRLADGRSVDADAAVLAVGNLPPHLPNALGADRLSPERYKGDPWAADTAEGLNASDTVLVIGTGLTMVDVALLLESKGFGGRIVALSRRGLIPHAHGGTTAAWDRINERPQGPATRIVRQVRQRAEQVGWHAAVDELRPFTQDIWRAASGAERERFLRHLRPWWDIHRHRIAPEVAARIRAMCDRGQLLIAAGKPLAFIEQTNGIEMSWRPRGSAETQSLHVDRIINCTGPQGDVLRTPDPLLRRLVDRGEIRPDAAHLGIDVDTQARVVRADGTSNERLFALGPMTRGAFWEIVAVPDIRRQTWSLARRLSNAHWVGGEGL